MHRSSVPNILLKKIYEISNNRENSNENPSMQAIIKILRAQTSEHLYKFCEQIEQRPNQLGAIENFKGPFDTPLKPLCMYKTKSKCDP